MIDFQTLNPKDIVLVDYPYDDDITQSKKRPAIIITKDDNTLEALVLKITSHPPRTQFDYQIVEWVKSNLRLESVARCNQTVVIGESQIIKKIGTLDDSDFKVVFKLYLTAK